MKQARRLLLFSFITTWLWSSLPPVHAQEPEPVPRFEPTPCFVAIPANQTIHCGYLIVPEDRTQPDPGGRTIRLAAAILKSRAAQPAPDPLIFLNGGPGAHALQDLPRFIGVFRLLLLDLNRDAILFDQRGVGLSQPALECPEVVPTLLAQAQGRVLTAAEEEAPYLACRDQWLSQGVNLAAYTVAASAADVNDLWRTLGYSQANLFSVSYGTVLAQTVMRDYPAGIRSVVLDSVLPLQTNLQVDRAANAAGYFKRVFSQCAANLLCGAFYPQVETTFYDLADRLNNAPANLTMAHPLTGDHFTFTFDGIALVDLAQTVPARELPALIYDLSEGDYSAVFKAKKTDIENFSRYGPPPGRALAYSIFCSQAMYMTPPDFDPLDASPEAAWADHHLNHDLLPLPCEKWPTAGPPDARPMTSDIPTLILLGELDHLLSPDYARLFSQNLTQSFSVTVPNTGHNVTGGAGPCANNLVRAYLNDPTTPPSTDCLVNTNRPVFDTTFLIRAAVMQRPMQGLLILLGLGLGLTAGVNIIAWRRASLRPGFAWRRSLRLVGWRTAAGSAGLLWLGWAAGQAGWLPLEPATMTALLLPIATALSAAFLFSPEDEPALELLLATPRPLPWLLLERLVALFLWQGGVGLAMSLYLFLTGENLLLNITGWLPPLVCLSGLAVYVTLATRRAIYGVLLVSLLWLVSAVFGDFIILRWPFTWPFHLYLQPDQVEYGLNRFFLVLAGVSLVAFTAPRLLRNEERLLFGNRPSKRRRLKTARSEKYTDAAAVPATAGLQFGLGAGVWLIPFYQIGAIIRYEFLMQWRRIALPALGLGLMLPPILGAFLSQNKISGYNTALATGALAIETVAASITAEMIMITWLGAFLVMILMLPVVVADTIPKDQHLGVREILDSLPLGVGVYLTGKVLSLWLSLAVSLGAAALVIAGVWRVVVGPFDPIIYAELWLVGIAPLAFINAGLAGLLAAWQPTNQRAMLVGGGFSLLCLLGIGFAFVTYGTFWDWLNPARPALILYYFIGWPGAMQGNEMLSRLNQPALELIFQVVNRQRVWQTLAVGVGQVGLVWLLVWQWRRQKIQ